MNECFFCGPTDNPLTEEHVWPKWVSRLLFGQYNSNHFVHVRSTGDNTTGLWKSRNLDVTTDTVCDKCNNVWLSNFESNEIKPLATPLILGNDDVLLPPAAQWKLAAWAYKMAMLLEVANPDDPRRFFAAADRKQFRDTTLARCFRHQLLLPRPYLVLTKPLRLDIQCQRGASVKIGWKYLDD